MSPPQLDAGKRRRVVRAPRALPRESRLGHDPPRPRPRRGAAADVVALVLVAVGQLRPRRHAEPVARLGVPIARRPARCSRCTRDRRSHKRSAATADRRRPPAKASPRINATQLGAWLIQTDFAGTSGTATGRRGRTSGRRERSSSRAGIPGRPGTSPRRPDRRRRR